MRPMKHGSKLSLLRAYPLNKLKVIWQFYICQDIECKKYWLIPTLRCCQYQCIQYAQFGQNPSSSSQGIERRRNADISQGSYISVINLWKLMINNPNLYLVNSAKSDLIPSICSKHMMIFSGNEMLTSIKDHNSVINLQKLMHNNSNPDLVNINAYAKFGRILSICSQDIEQRRNSDINKGPKLTHNNS